MLALPGAHILLFDFFHWCLYEPAGITCRANLMFFEMKLRPLITFLAYVKILIFQFSTDSVITDIRLSIPYRDNQILLNN